MTYPNGVTTSYSYDTLNRLTRLKADVSSTPITDFQYVYDAAGNRTRKQQLDYAEDYSYDPLYRLAGVERTGGLTGIWHYGYDPVGNRLTAQINDSVLTSVFNEKNQLTGSSGGGTLEVRGALSEPGTAKVNGNPARMLAGNVFEAPIQATTGTNTFTVKATDQSGNVTTKNYQVNVTAMGATYTYDLNGNLTQKVEGADTWTYEWTAENELKRVLLNGVEQARFAYDPLGRRVERVAGGVTTSWTYDAQDILRQVAGGTTTKFIHGPGIDEPLAVEDGTGALSYYHSDGLGSIVKTTDAAGAVTQTIRYEAWGVIEQGSPSPFGFTGREPDVGGLAYYRARYLDPRLGRFLSEDPIGTMGGLNFYTYVDNNAPNLSDPDGLVLVQRKPFPIPPPNGSTSWVRWWIYYMALDCWENPAVFPMIGPGVVIQGGKAGAALGARAFMKFTRKGKRTIINQNTQAKGGVPQCEKCGVQTQPPVKHQPGVTPPANEHHVDHIIKRSLGGDGDPSNGQLLCRVCNLKGE